MKKLLVFIFVTPILLIATAIGLVWFTEIPVKLLETALRDSGIDVQGMSGNLNRGLTVQTIKMTNDQGSFSAQDLAFEYNGIWDAFTQKRVVFERIQARKVEIRLIHGLMGDKKRKFTPPGQAAQQPQDPGQQPGQQKVKFDWSALKEIRFKLVEFSDVSIRAPGMVAPNEIKLYRVADAVKTEQEFTIAEVKVDSTMIDLLAKGIKSTATQIFSHEGEITGKIKPGLFKELKAEVPFVVVAEQGQSPFPGIRITAFDGKIQARMSMTGGLEYQVTSFNPKEYFIASAPVTEINVSGQATIAQLAAGMFPAQGEIKLGPVTFKTGFAGQSVPNTLQGVHAFAQDSGANFLLVFKPRLSKESVAQTTPWWELVSDKYPQPIDALAWLYYRKPLAKITGGDRTRLDEDVAGLAAYVPVEVPASTQAALNEAAAAPPRTPAAMPVPPAPTPGAPPAAAPPAQAPAAPASAPAAPPSTPTAK